MYTEYIKYKAYVIYLYILRLH